MERLSAPEIVMMFLAIGTLLCVARVLGELAKRFGQPAVLGEIIAGVILGPTLIGRFAPGLHSALFPEAGALALVLDGIVILSVTLFLFVAGMEVDLGTIWRQGKLAMSVSVSGIVFPFGVGLIAAWTIPRALGREHDADSLIFALFFATALSISALPVIAKTLMDLNLYRTVLGMVVVAAAIFNDLVGWIIFAIVLGMMAGADNVHAFPVAYTIVLTLLFAAFILSIGRWLIHLALPWIQAHTSWPGGVLTFAITTALLCAAFTEWIGVHAIFGAFLFGVALGDSSHLREETQATLDRFISFFFAPIFFASIGLRVDFIAHFDWLVVVVVLVIACIGKVIGCGLGARWGGLPWRDSWAVGFGMNARGAMEIILGLIALQAGVIGERLFVALVVMALVTSVISGPAMQRILRQKSPRRFSTYLFGKTFRKPLIAADRWDAIRQLSALTAEAHDLDSAVVTSAVIAREQIMSTGLGHGVAVPHARLSDLSTPLVAVGISDTGIDFGAPDAQPARLIFLILTPADDDRAQIEILADIARTFSQQREVAEACEVAGYTEFLALTRSAAGDSHSVGS